MMISEHQVAVIGGLYLHPLNFPFYTNTIEICDLQAGTCVTSAATLPDAFGRSSHSCVAVDEDGNGIAENVLIVGFLAQAYEWTPSTGAFKQIAQFPGGQGTPVSGAFLPFPDAYEIADYYRQR